MSKSMSKVLVNWVRVSKDGNAVGVFFHQDSGGFFPAIAGVAWVQRLHASRRQSAVGKSGNTSGAVPSSCPLRLTDLR